MTNNIQITNTTQLDSLDIGTPSKGGNLKIYFNSQDPPEINDKRIIEALRVREQVRQRLENGN